jgi:hypothetical protein
MVIVLLSANKPCRAAGWPESACIHCSHIEEPAYTCCNDGPHDIQPLTINPDIPFCWCSPPLIRFVRDLPLPRRQTVFGCLECVSLRLGSSWLWQSSSTRSRSFTPFSFIDLFYYHMPCRPSRFGLPTPRDQFHRAHSNVSDLPAPRFFISGSGSANPSTSIPLRRSKFCRRRYTC